VATKNSFFWDVTQLVTATDNATTAAPILPISVTLMMEALLSSVLSVLTRATQRNTPEDGIFLNSVSPC
jgi:hypothetical protein